MVYAAWLFGFSLIFLVWERLMPRRDMPILRRGIANDLFYLIVNGEYLGVLLGAIAVHAIAAFDRALDLTHLKNIVYMNVMADAPFWLQLIILLIVFDFCQWLIHNLLHRVPFLWEFHKVHHSITELDWIGHWRFHWAESVFYKSILYIPAAFFGFSPAAMFWYAVIATFVGHFAHSNLRIKIGPLRYIINSPEMHIWHHNHADAGPINKNFALTLAIWDWLFKTAHIPNDQNPTRLGFSGDEAFPRSLWRQLLIPFIAKREGHDHHKTN